MMPELDHGDEERVKFRQEDSGHSYTQTTIQRPDMMVDITETKRQN